MPPPDHDQAAGLGTAIVATRTVAAGNPVSFGTTTTAAHYSWVFPGGTPATSSAQNPGNVVFQSEGTYVAPFA